MVAPTLELIVNLAAATVAANLAATLASTGADAARTTGMIIGAAVFLLAGITLLVAMRFRATRKRNAASESSTGNATDSLNAAE
jgi:hypothetical protein